MLEVKDMKHRSGIRFVTVYYLWRTFFFRVGNSLSNLTFVLAEQRVSRLAQCESDKNNQYKEGLSEIDLTDTLYLIPFKMLYK